MLGRQLVFFLGPNDQVQLDVALRAAGAKFLPSRPSTPMPSPIDTTVVANFGTDRLRVLLARACDIVTYVPVKGRSEYACDPIKEPVIEYDRSYVSETLIRSGRLFFVPAYPDAAGTRVNKNSEFVAWADGILRATRRRLHRIGPSLYAGNQALQLKNAGIMLEGT